MRLRALITLLAVAAAGCHAREERIVVGSKNFGEQVLLGEIVARTIERHTGLAVERRLNLGGTFLCDRAIRAGKLDLYVEYTGTAYTAILKRPPIADPKQVLAEAREAYAKDGLEWLSPFGFDNTFAIVVRGADADRLGLRSISGLAAHTDWRAGFGYEFMERSDGFRGLAKVYGLAFRKPPRIMELGLLYRALVENQVDVVAGNSTDGLIASLDLRVLEDDRRYFPPYEAAPIVRRELLERRPEVRKALESLAGSISAETMRRLNYRVEGERRLAEEVAGDFVESLRR